MKYFDELIERHPVLKSCSDDILKGYAMLEQCYAEGGKLLVAGNGGSAADAEHIVGELMKGFCLPRKIPSAMAEALREIDSTYGNELAQKLQGALPAIALANHNALNTAYLNDVDGLLCYAQQVMGYGKAGGCLFGDNDFRELPKCIVCGNHCEGKGAEGDWHDR